MSTEIITITKKTDLTLMGTVSGMTTLEGYTIKMTVKKNPADESPAMEVDGTAEGLNLTFEVTNVDSDIDAGVYLFDVIAEDETKRYELASGKLEVVVGIS